MTEPAMQQCIICDAKLELAIDDPSYNQPSRGTVFSSSGHYGSTFWDPMVGGVRLEITVCDECLTEALSRGRILLATDITAAPTTRYEVLDANYR